MIMPDSRITHTYNTEGYFLKSKFQSAAHGSPGIMSNLDVLLQHPSYEGGPESSPEKPAEFPS